MAVKREPTLVTPEKVTVEVVLAVAPAESRLALTKGLASVVVPTETVVAWNPTGSVVAVVWALMLPAATIESAHAAMEEERRCFILVTS